MPGAVWRGPRLRAASGRIEGKNQQVADDQRDGGTSPRYGEIPHRAMDLATERWPRWATGRFQLYRCIIAREERCQAASTMAISSCSGAAPAPRPVGGHADVLEP